MPIYEDEDERIEQDWIFPAGAVIEESVKSPTFDIKKETPVFSGKKCFSFGQDSNRATAPFVCLPEDEWNNKNIGNTLKLDSAENLNILTGDFDRSGFVIDWVLYTVRNGREPYNLPKQIFHNYISNVAGVNTLFTRFN